MAEIEVRVRQNGKPYLRVRLNKSPATIGRDPDADVFLDSTAVSRLHARLFFDRQGVRIVDAGSTNGLKVDGAQHAKADLSPEQTVTICEFALRARPISKAAALGEELSEGWLEIEDLEDDDTSVGAADTNVHRLQQQPTEPADEARERSVLLRDDDVSVEGELDESATQGEDAPYYDDPPDADATSNDELYDDGDEGQSEHTPIPEIDEQADTAAELSPGDTGHDPNEQHLSQSALTFSDEEDDADAEHVPDDLPPMINVMRHHASELEGAKRIAIEVLVSVGQRLHDVALVRPNGQYWWGPQPGFPASLWTVPALEHFPMVVHREDGGYNVQVPQDSPWKMYHRGAGKAATYRSGKLVGMQVGYGEQAEASYGPYTVYMRCVKAPPPLVGIFDPKRWLPSPAAAAAFAIAALLNIIVVALPAEQRRFFETSAPPEHFVAFDNGERPPPQPPELPVPDLAAPPPAPVALSDDAPPKNAEPGFVANPKEKRNDRPPLPVKPEKAPPDPNAGVTTLEAAPTPPKQVSIGDFRVAGLLKGVPEPMIQKNHGPPVSGGAAMLRGERAGNRTALMGKDGTGSTIIPPGRIESIDLQKTINAHQREAMQCYTQVGLRDNPESAGKLELQWTVEESGQARRVRVIVDELRSAPMTKCMTEAISRWTFPTPTGGPAVVSYPFRFTNPNL